jgi:hypothetical protein
VRVCENKDAQNLFRFLLHVSQLQSGRPYS